MKKDEALRKKLMDTFAAEAEEGMERIQLGLRRLVEAEDSGNRSEILIDLHRSAHSLRGASRSVERIDLEGLFRSLERIFDNMLEAEPSVEVAAALRQSVKGIGDILSGVADSALQEEIASRLRTLEQDR